MKKVLLILVSLLFLACPAYAEVSQLHIGLSTGYPPFYFFDEDDQPAGICIEIVNRVAQSMNISVHYDSYPWRRMLDYGKEGRVDAVMPLFKTDERQRFLTFPEAGLIDEENSFFTSRPTTINYAGQPAEMIHRKVGVIDKFSYGEEFDKTDFTDKTVVQGPEQLILLLLHGRVELGVGNSKVLSSVARKMDVLDQIHFLSPPVTVDPLFIGFSKKRIDQDFVDQFSKQLKAFKATRAYADIIQAY